MTEQRLGRFAPRFKAGDIFSYPTSDGCYFVGVYLGGIWQNTVEFMHIIRHVFDSTEMDADTALNYGFLYRQPLNLRLDGSRAEKIGHSAAMAAAEYRCLFRTGLMNEAFYDWQLAQVEAFNTQGQSEHEAYLAWLHSMYRQGRYVLLPQQWLYELFLLQGGRVVQAAPDKAQAAAEAGADSYPLGTFFGSAADIEASLYGEGQDSVHLIDFFERDRPHKGLAPFKIFQAA